MELKFDDRGLITAVVQDINSREVLMVAWMNREALERSIETRQAHFYSRSRACLWHKGETSGHFLNIHHICVDCDGDTLLVLVTPCGPACHTGAPSCFYRTLDTLNPLE